MHAQGRGRFAAQQAPEAFGLQTLACSTHLRLAACALLCRSPLLKLSLALPEVGRHLTKMRLEHVPHLQNIQHPFPVNLSEAVRSHSEVFLLALLDARVGRVATLLKVTLLPWTYLLLLLLLWLHGRHLLHVVLQPVAPAAQAMSRDFVFGGHGRFPAFLRTRFLSCNGKRNCGFCE
jgi:hypothetical protein